MKLRDATVRVRRSLALLPPFSFSESLSFSSSRQRGLRKCGHPPDHFCTYRHRSAWYTCDVVWCVSDTESSATCRQPESARESTNPVAAARARVAQHLVVELFYVLGEFFFFFLSFIFFYRSTKVFYSLPRFKRVHRQTSDQSRRQHLYSSANDAVRPAPFYRREELRARARV